MFFNQHTRNTCGVSHVMSCSIAVSLHNVVEVREGQRSTRFDKFPYEQVEKQSFSLVYLHEGINWHRSPC